MELADFGGIVHMFADAGAEIIVADTHYANGFDAVWKTGEVEMPLGLLNGNYILGYIQIRGKRLIDHCIHFPRFVIYQGSGEVVVTLGLLLVHVGAEASATMEFPDHCLIEYVFRRMHARDIRFFLRLLGEGR
ncbi:hypothetical protein [Desulfocastanea catecholica]